MKMLRTVSVIASSVVAFASQQAMSEQTPIKIGFEAELSGPQATLGEDQYAGFMLRVLMNGGKLGGVPVQVIREDSQLKPEVAAQVTQKLIEKDNVPIITGLTFSPMAAAAVRVATPHKVFVVISNGTTNPMAGAECSPYQFVTSWQPELLSATLAKYANDKGYKRISLMAPNYVSGKNFLATFKHVFKGQVPDEIYTPLSQQDFSAEILQVSASKPDAVFVFYPGGLGINFVRQYQQAGLGKTTPLLALGAVDGNNLTALKDAALGAVTSGAWSPDLDNAANREFVAAFEKQYHREPTMFAAQSYDAAQLIDSAIAKVKGNMDDKEALGAALKEAKFATIRGHFSFAKNHFPNEDYDVLEAVKDGKGGVTLKLIAAPMHDPSDPFVSACALK